MSNRPNIEESEILDFLRSNYTLEGSLKPLPSERDQNFQLSGKNQYVVKISQLIEKKESLQFQNAALLHLEQKGQQGAPTLIPNSKGEKISIISSEGNDYFFRVLTYLNGKVIAKVNPHSQELLNTFGKFLGEINTNLKGFEFEDPTIDFYWSLKQAPSIIQEYRSHVKDSDQISILEFYDDFFKSHLFPLWGELRESIVHNDANDYNVLVDNDGNIGLIDYGDMVWSFTISDIVVGLTYILLDKKDPLSIIRHVITGYSKTANLSDLEMKLIFPLICLRLCQSVSISTFQSSREPDNAYLTISQKPAWDALKTFQSIHPNLVYYLIREIYGLDPHPYSKTLLDELKNHEFHPIIEFEDDLIYVEQGIDSPELYYRSVNETDPSSRMIYELSRDNPDKTLIGRYDEIRLVYLQESFEAPSNDMPKFRNVHVGIDIFSVPGSTVMLPLDGVVYGIGKHIRENDSGTIVFIEHELDNIKFYTLYGHLANDSVSHIKVGDKLDKGTTIGLIGTSEENGGWLPHVHFQIVLDLLYSNHDFPGVCTYEERMIYHSLCPDPFYITGIKSKKALPPELSNIRDKYIGKSLSLSYRKPLTIVRGYMQYLFDIHGNRYLDAVNNVPHVGHSHPEVVRALHVQSRILNTNTRYLHDSILRYSEKLLSYFPDKFEICFFVNSGSEANELALRLAKNFTKSNKIIVLDHAYHGNTNANIEISPYKFNGPGGSGASENVSIVSLPDPFRPVFSSVQGYIDEIKNSIANIAPDKPIMIAEPISGVGGQIFLEPTYLASAFDEIRKNGGVSIADEVQIGFGRIGTHFWGFQYHQSEPDIVTLGKPIANGHPMGAVITTREIAEKFANGMEFFSTFGGNPVSCEAAYTVLEIIERDQLTEHAKSIGDLLLNGFKELKLQFPIIGDVRGSGLFLGIELILNGDKIPAPEQATYIVNRMKEKGILLSTDGPYHNVIKLKPPMCITQNNAEFLLTKLKEVLNEDGAQIL